jgi:serine/threonine-protein kinase
MRVDRERPTLAERYRLVEVIGTGGMSTVYRASDLLLGRIVAVKVMSAAMVEPGSHSVARFRREAHAAASLAHPGVVTVYDFGVDGQDYFIVMEYVKGRSVAAALKAGGPFVPARAVPVAAQVADVLGAAHEAGIVHRDIKPDNVMLPDDGGVKVLDFGIARLQNETALTHTSSLIGTAAYMAPERVLGARADARSDIYSLGCFLYAMLAGEPPFTGEVAAAVLNQHAHAGPPQLQKINRDVPPALSALVAQMLAKSPRARPQSATEVSERLQKLRVEAATKPRMPRPAPTERLEPRPTGAAATRVLPHRVAASRGPRRMAVIALAGMVLIIVVIALASASGLPRHTSTSGTHSSHPVAASPAPGHLPSQTVGPSHERGAIPSGPVGQPQPGPGVMSPGHHGQPPGQASKHDHPGGGGGPQGDNGDNNQGDGQGD